MKHRYLICEETTDLGELGGGGYSESVKTPEATTEKKVETPETVKEPKYDKFGYVIADEAEAVVEEKKADEKVPDEVAGYGEKIDDSQSEKKVEEPPPKEEKTGLEYELDVKDLDSKEVDKIVDLAKKFSLPKEAAQALVENKKLEIKFQNDVQAEVDKIRKEKISDLRKAWHRELRSDPAFGGEQFGKTIKNVDKVLADHLPGLKKQLTDNKAMLPPYVMRDLAKLADHLYSTPKLVQGDEGSAEKETIVEKRDPTEFYKTKT